jgi:hypothetical protein
MITSPLNELSQARVAASTEVSLFRRRLTFEKQAMQLVANLNI